MKLYRGWTILLIVGLSGCASQMRSSDNAGLRFPSDQAAITAVFDTTTAGWNRGELPVYLSAYTESATAMGRNGPERGVNAIGDQMRAGFWKTGRPAQQLHYEHLEIRPLGPDNALVTGIWTRTPAGWRMIHDHSS